MVHQQALGLDRLRISLDRLPVQVPSLTRFLPGALVLPFFAYRIPEMIVSYADAAALMLANLSPDVASGAPSRRIGVTRWYAGQEKTLDSQAEGERTASIDAPIDVVSTDAARRETMMRRGRRPVRIRCLTARSSPLTPPDRTCDITVTVT